MLLEAVGTARDLGRLHDIVSVLARHGLGDFVQRSGALALLKRAGRAVRLQAVERIESVPTPVRVRRALEDLGPTFVKVGQLLAGRSDVLPEAWTREFASLQERARAVPWDEIRAQLSEDLGAPPEEVFAELEPEPLAAASIAQVHRARTRDGAPIVLKVRRPGIAEVVESDLRLLVRLAELVEQEIAELRPLRPRALARHLARSITDELDLRIEARHAVRMAANLSGMPDIRVPRVFPAWSGPRLLVEDHLEGQSAAAWLRAGRPGDVDGARVARLGAQAVMRMIFLDGLYHADPHPGNVLLLGGDRIGLIDFGMVGRLSDSRRAELLRLAAAVGERDEEGAVDLLLGWSPDAEVDTDLFAYDCAAFIDRYHGITLAELDAAALFSDLAALVRENHLSLPLDVAGLLKVFVTLQALGKELDPHFDMTAHLRPFAREALRRRTSPSALFARGAREVEGLMRGLPRDLTRLLSRARRGRFRVDLDLRRLEAFGHDLDRSANRLTVGMVTSALIVGTAISLTVTGGPRLFGLPLFATLGFASSILVGLVLILSIVRAGRR